MATSITWHGHAAFQVATSGCNIIIDPFFTGNSKAVIGWESIPRPDFVLLTHMHSDHVGDAVTICKHTGAMLGAVVGTADALQAAGLPPEQILNGIGFNIGGTVTVKGVAVTMTQAFHTSEAGVPVGFILTLPGGFTIYHAGDTGIFSSMTLWGKLYSIDLALLPTGGAFTMDDRQAALAAAMLKAKAVIPMHWGTFPVLSQNIDDFASELAMQAPECHLVAMQPGQTLPLPL